MFAHDAVSSQQRRYIHFVVARRLTGVSMKWEEFFLLGKQWEITTGNTRVTGSKWESACWRTSTCVRRLAEEEASDGHHWSGVSFDRLHLAVEPLYLFS